MCTAVSSASSGRARSTGSPATLAAAAAPKSAPAWGPSNRNNRRAAGDSVRYDQDSTARRSVPGSSPANASSRAPASRSARASVASGTSGWMVARAATIASASGSLAHRAMISSTASGSARDPAGADPPGKQLPRLGLGEHVERDRVRGLGDDQAGEPVAAGHHARSSPASRAAATGRARCPARCRAAPAPACGDQAAEHGHPSVQHWTESPRARRRATQAATERPGRVAAAICRDRTRAG